MSEVEAGSGTGAALNAEAVTLTRAEYDALVAKGLGPPLHDPVAAAHEAVAAAERKIDRYRAHIAGAEQALVEAKAELAAVIEGA